MTDWLGTLVVASSVKSAVVLAAGAAAALAMRRGSAASRHLAWSIAVVGALGIPVLSAMLPGWRISPAMPWPVPPEPSARPIPWLPSRPTATAAGDPLRSAAMSSPRSPRPQAGNLVGPSVPCRRSGTEPTLSLSLNRSLKLRRSP